jgi:hypothetical protein
VTASREDALIFRFERCPRFEGLFDGVVETKLQLCAARGGANCKE